MKKLKRKAKNPIHETFVTLSDWKIDSQEVKDEIREIERKKAHTHSLQACALLYITDVVSG